MIALTLISIMIAWNIISLGLVIGLRSSGIKEKNIIVNPIQSAIINSINTAALAYIAYILLKQ